MEDEWRQGDAAGQLLQVAGKLHGLKLRDFGELLSLGWRDDGDLLGDVEGPLQLLRALGAEELVDDLLGLLQVAADHAQPCHVQDDGDGERHQAHGDEVQPQPAVSVGHAQSDGVVSVGSHAAGGHAGVAAAVLEGDNRDVEDTLLLDLPLPSWNQSEKEKKLKHFCS